MDTKRYNTKASVFLETTTPFTTWERVKVLLLFWTVIPRVLVALVILLTFALFSYIASAGWPQDRPMRGWRREMMKFCRYFSISCAYLMGFRVIINGWQNFKQAEKDGIRIAVFNHVSYVDAFVIVGLMAPSGLSKESNKNLPILGACVRGLQNIYLPDHRQIIKDAAGGKKESSNRSDSVAALIAERARDPRYPMLALAPEGTCGNGRSLLKFRTGAFVSGAPVLPVLLKYDVTRVNPAWTILNESVHFLRVMCQVSNKVEVVFMEPYYPSDDEKSDATLYAENVRRLMGSAMKMPLVDESYNHVYALLKLGVQMASDGETITAPPGVIDEDGFVDLSVILDKKKD